MRFVLAMAGREMRASWRRLLFFFICVAIGVGGIVALRSVIQNIRVTLVQEAKTLTRRREPSSTGASPPIRSRSERNPSRR
jgi:putative ABC transport system permease protein